MHARTHTPFHTHAHVSNAADFDTLKDMGVSGKASTIFVPHSPGSVGSVSQEIRTGFMQARYFLFLFFFLGGGGTSCSTREMHPNFIQAQGAVGLASKQRGLAAYRADAGALPTPPSPSLAVGHGRGPDHDALSHASAASLELNQPTDLNCMRQQISTFSAVVSSTK